MSLTKRITDIGILFSLVCTLVYTRRPDAYLLFIAGCVVLAVTSVYGVFRASPVDRDQMRRDSWIVPVVMSLFAAYVVYNATPEQRTFAWLLAGGLVAAGFAIFALRRRVS